MSELRRCPFTGRWVVIAPERRARPVHVDRPTPAASSSTCPLCPEGESLTPHVLWRDGDPWQVRVVPNGRPALRVEVMPDPRPEGAYDRMDGSGAHEVIVEGRAHRARPWRDHPEVVRLTLLALRNRIRDLRRDARFQAITWFKDQGPGTGAHIEHPHSQLMALPFVPSTLARNLQAHATWHALRGRCLTCDVLYEERAARLRIVDQRDHFVAWTPFASRSPFEVWIAPRRHASALEATGDGELAELAELVAGVLGRLDTVLSDPPLQAGLLSDEVGALDAPFHWRIEVHPRLAPVGAFELVTGSASHAVPPEEAAAWLRGERG